MKKALFLMCGLCWFMFGLGFGFFLLQYLAGGTGWQALSPIQIGFCQTLMGGMGLMQGAGFFLASAFCFVVGLGLCSHGLEPKRDKKC